jgi:peptidoglycan/xylan/chitin deacetylase (PgdA/CDA1 family)
MICLTGDIHHDSLKINDQRFLPDGLTELEVCRKYLRLIEKYGLKATFYTTGMTLREQWDDFKVIAESDLVEVGGHTFGGLPRKAGGGEKNGEFSCSHSDFHGTYGEQEEDVLKMIEIVREKTGRKPVSWRSHGLVRDENTDAILYNNGIRFISDELNWNKLLPEKTESGLISHAMNVLMDHDHLYHAHRTLEYVEKQRKNWPLRDDPTSKSFDIETWGRIVEAQVRAINELGGLATILMHPVCMYLADEFKTAEKLFEYFASCDCIWAHETDKLIN